MVHQLLPSCNCSLHATEPDVDDSCLLLLLFLHVLVGMMAQDLAQPCSCMPCSVTCIRVCGQGGKGLWCMLNPVSHDVLYASTASQVCNRCSGCSQPEPQSLSHKL
jgi:hypothetical protein